VFSKLQVLSMHMQAHIDSEHTFFSERERETERERVCVCVCARAHASQSHRPTGTLCQLGPIVIHNWDRVDPHWDRGDPQLGQRIPMDLWRATGPWRPSVPIVRRRRRRRRQSRRRRRRRRRRRCATPSALSRPRASAACEQDRPRQQRTSCH
jgi:hypothetical protein